MSMVGRLVGWGLFFIGLALLVRDLVFSVANESLRVTVLGEIWYKLSPETLNLAQAIVQRYIHPKLWDPVIQSILLWWAAPVFLVPGIALAVLCRRRDDRVRWRR